MRFPRDLSFFDPEILLAAFVGGVTSSLVLLLLRSRGLRHRTWALDGGGAIAVLAGLAVALALPYGRDQGDIAPAITARLLLGTAVGLPLAIAETLTWRRKTPVLVLRAFACAAVGLLCGRLGPGPIVDTMHVALSVGITWALLCILKSLAADHPGDVLLVLCFSLLTSALLVDSTTEPFHLHFATLLVVTAAGLPYLSKIPRAAAGRGALGTLFLSALSSYLLQERSAFRPSWNATGALLLPTIALLTMVPGLQRISQRARLLLLLGSASLAALLLLLT